MTVRFAREPLTDALWDEAYPLLLRHWREVAHFQDIPLEPDVARYRENERAGVLRCYTARDTSDFASWRGHRVEVLGYSEPGFATVLVEGYEASDSAPIGEILMEPQRLVGYELVIVAPNAHYKSSTQAVQDVLYLDPTFRGGTALKFIAWCDEQLAAEGVQAVYQHIKAAHQHGHRAMKYLGYSAVDIIYAKRLDVAQPAPASEPALDRPSLRESLDEAFI